LTANTGGITGAFRSLHGLQLPLREDAGSMVDQEQPARAKINGDSMPYRAADFSEIFQLWKRKEGGIGNIGAWTAVEEASLAMIDEAAI
jgi:hypothetical protein